MALKLRWRVRVVPSDRKQCLTCADSNVVSCERSREVRQTENSVLLALIATQLLVKEAVRECDIATQK